jgi:hypothetical protein
VSYVVVFSRFGMFYPEKSGNPDPRPQFQLIFFFLAGPRQTGQTVNQTSTDLKQVFAALPFGLSSTHFLIKLS